MSDLLNPMSVVPTNIEDELKTSYLAYSMSVIVGRAIPDVRDGLKPVHRRILFTMHEMNNTHTTPYKKSARIVGDCFVAGTLVHTERGLAPIEELNVGDMIRLADGSLSGVVQTYQNPPSEILEVTLSNGVSLEVTPDQRFRVLTDELQIVWVEAKNLEGKRVLVTNPRAMGVPEAHPDAQRTDLSYLCGLIVAEGSGHSLESPYVRVNMTDEEPIEFLSQYCAKTNVGLHRNIIRAKQPHYKPQHHASFKEIPELREACEKTSAFKVVPSWILAERRLFAPFIAGFTDGDGYIRDSSTAREVVLASISKTLLSQLQIMLADSGIHSNLAASSLKERPDGANRQQPYALSFTGENASAFCRLVRDYLKIPKKQAAADKLIHWQGRVLNAETECIPSEAIFRELSRHHLGGGWYLDKEGNKFRAGVKYPNGKKIKYEKNLVEKNISYRQLEEWGILDKLAKIGSPLLEKLRDIARNYCVVEAKSIEKKSEPAENFDIQIAHESHAFIAHGTIISNCMGKYHPHGDAAIYDAMVRMAQEFNMRYMLVDGQGNFGSVDGDAPAAQRYTEVRLDKLSQELLSDIEKETVEFGPNYDDTLQEPLVLPSKVPNLLLNGSEGIAVGMATKIPPHNLTELLNGTIALIDNEETSLDELITIIPGPDFPTAGIIHGLEGIHSAYKTGRGILKMRGKVDIETHPKTDRETLIITEIPYQVNKAKLIEKIADLIKEKKIEGITDIRDESNREGMRVVIELKRDIPGAFILNHLYKMTPLESSFGVILLSIVDGRPQVLNIKQILQRFIEHRREVVTRRTVYELRKAEERLHLLLGLLMAVDHIDRVISIIRNSPDTETARRALCDEEFNGELGKLQLFAGLSFPQVEEAARTGIFKMSEIQAKAILELRLNRLTGLERDKVLGEAQEVRETILRLKEILGKDDVLMSVIRRELEEIRDKYGDERRTKIIPAEGEISMEDLINREDMVITVSHAGYIKRSSTSLYRSQRRGGRGKSSMSTKEEDFVSDLFVASTHHHFLIFTDRGRVFSKKVYEIPATSTAAKGKAIVNLIPLEKVEKVAAFMPVAEFKQGTYIVFATKNGVVKKTDLSLFGNIRQSGIIALLIDEGDQLISVRMTSGKQDLFLGTKEGLSIRFAEEELRPLGRAARGVKGISLKDNDCLVGMEVLSEDNETILTVCENGYGKRTEVSEYRDQHRGGSGVITIKATERNGDVVGFSRVGDDDQIMVVTNKGSLIRTPAKEIRICGRNTQGVRIIFNDEEGEKVVGLARLPKEEGAPEDTTAATTASLALPAANGSADDKPKSDGPLDPTKN